MRPRLGLEQQMTSSCDMASTAGLTLPLLEPTPSANNTNSKSSDLWFRLFVAKDVNFDSSKLTPLKYERYFCHGVQEYAGLLDADSPDLTDFRKAGGTLNSYHGMVHCTIPQLSSQRLQYHNSQCMYTGRPVNSDETFRGILSLFRGSRPGSLLRRKGRTTTHDIWYSPPLGRGRCCAGDTARSFQCRQWNRKRTNSMSVPCQSNL